MALQGASRESLVRCSLWETVSAGSLASSRITSEESTAEEGGESFFLPMANISTGTRYALTAGTWKLSCPAAIRVCHNVEPRGSPSTPQHIPPARQVPGPQRCPQEPGLQCSLPDPTALNLPLTLGETLLSITRPPYPRSYPGVSMMWETSGKNCQSLNSLPCPPQRNTSGRSTDDCSASSFSMSSSLSCMRTAHSAPEGLGNPPPPSSCFISPRPYYISGTASSRINSSTSYLLRGDLT